MKVSQVMTKSVITAHPGTPFDELVDLMLRNGVSALPVVDDQRRVLGIVSEADIVSKEAYGGRRRRLLDVLVDVTSGGGSRWAVKGRGAVAKELMTAGPRTVSPDADLHAVARLMVDLHYKRFPVVEDGVLVGIVSRRDVLRLLHRSDDELSVDLAVLLADPFRSPERHAVTATVAHGVVTLTGSVLHPADKPVLTGAVWSLAGVVDVHDETSARERDAAASNA